MRASVGDRLVIKGHNVGDHDRDAEILEVHGEEGFPTSCGGTTTDTKGCSFPAQMPWSSTFPATHIGA